MKRKGMLLAGLVLAAAALAWHGPPAAAQQMPQTQAMAGSGQTTGGLPPAAKAMAGAGPAGPVALIAAPFPQPPPPSTKVRVAILDTTTSLQRAGRIAVLLTQFRKHELEQHIGMKIELSNISGIPERPAMGNIVFYRPEFLRAAALLAKAIPGEQVVRVMTPERQAMSAVDVEIVLGEPTP